MPSLVYTTSRFGENILRPTGVASLVTVSVINQYKIFRENWDNRTMGTLSGEIS
jgi:hypothetical protein